MSIGTHTRLISAGFTAVYAALMAAMVLTSSNMDATLRNAVILYGCTPTGIVGIVLIAIAKLTKTTD